MSSPWGTVGNSDATPFISVGLNSWISWLERILYSPLMMSKYMRMLFYPRTSGQVQRTKEQELWNQQRLEQLFRSALNWCEHILLDSLHPPPSPPSLTPFSKGVREGRVQWRGNCIMPPSLPECWSIPLWTLTGGGKCILCPLSHINVRRLLGCCLVSLCHGLWKNKTWTAVHVK